MTVLLVVICLLVAILAYTRIAYRNMSADMREEKLRAEVLWRELLESRLALSKLEGEKRLVDGALEAYLKAEEESEEPKTTEYAVTGTPRHIPWSRRKKELEQAARQKRRQLESFREEA